MYYIGKYIFGRINACHYYLFKKHHAFNSYGISNYNGNKMTTPKDESLTFEDWLDDNTVRIGQTSLLPTFEATWNASRRAFADELVSKLEAKITTDDQALAHFYNGAIKGFIDIIRKEGGLE